MPRSRWTHAICIPCWYQMGRNPGPALNHQIRGLPPELCCYCRKQQSYGLYVRELPDNVPCQGEHGNSDKECQQQPSV